MRSIHLYSPVKLAAGAGCRREFVRDVSKTGCLRILVVTFPEVIPLLDPLFRDIKQKGINLYIDDSIRKEPDFRDFYRIMDLAMEHNPELILGIGGGSVLDVAKIVAAMLNNTQKLDEIIGSDKLSARTTKLACMPTTSGTGSEVSPNAILLDEDEKLKKGIISPHLVPDLCYVDPELTLSVPSHVTAATGIDAFTHCLEAYINRYAHPLVDTYALEGMKLITRSLETAVREPGNLRARSDLSLGSLFGGMCLGPVNTAAVHALSYPLGSEFHVAHGLSNALLLPYVMEFNLPVAEERFAKIAGMLGYGEKFTMARRAESAIEGVRELIRKCGLPGTLSEINIPRDAIPAMADSAMKIQRLLKNNPREVCRDDVIEIYNKAF